MNVQNVIMGSRVAHVRELRAEVDRLKDENARLRDEAVSRDAHFDLALLAAMDLRNLPPNGRQVVFDGWNLILGAQHEALNRSQLAEQARAHLAEHPHDSVWIVYDGPKASTVLDGRVRVTYTGGSGPHRADRLICDYVRMARYLGLADRLLVRTNDKDFQKAVRTCGAEVVSHWQSHTTT